MNPSKQPQIKKQNINPVSENKSWIEFVFDDSRLAIPVGPRFQADLPDLMMISPGKHDAGYKFESSKWLGLKVWPTGGGNKEINNELIGKGRSGYCLCVSPGSVECTKKHTADKRIQLQSEVGPAFWKWKFDSMGEDVSKLWNLEEEKKFQAIVKIHTKSVGQTFINSALNCLPCQSRENIISYYYNVHIPRRMSKQSRLDDARIDTDDESDDTPPSKGSRKRLQSNNDSLEMRKNAKTGYLTDRR